MPTKGLAENAVQIGRVKHPPKSPTCFAGIEDATSKTSYFTPRTNDEVDAFGEKKRDSGGIYAPHHFAQHELVVVLAKFANLSPRGRDKDKVDFAAHRAHTKACNSKI